MPEIITRNSDSTKRVISDTNPKTYIVIDDCEEGFKKFKMCLRRSREEQEYAYGMGDKRYDRALAELLHSNYGVYMKFQDMLRDELSNRK